MKYLLILFFLVLVSCNASEEQSPKTKAIQKVLFQTASELCEEHNFYLVGFGSAAYKEVKELGLRFSSKDQCDVDVGRRLILKTVQTLTKNINNDLDVREYLIKYPFSEKSVDVAIFFNEHDKPIEKPYLSRVTSRKGAIKYWKKGPDDFASEIFFGETYDEALKIIQEQGLEKSK